MSTSMTSLRPDSLSGTLISIDRCDCDIGNHLALSLAELGAAIRLQGKDSVRLHDLQMAITARWGRAVVAPAGQDAMAAPAPSPDAMIRMFSSATLAPNPSGEAADAQGQSREPAKAMIRICASPEAAKRAIESGDAGASVAEILIVNGNRERDQSAFEQWLGSSDDRRLHAILLPFGDDENAAHADEAGALTALIALLLTAAGKPFPNQCFSLESRAKTPPRNADYPVMPVCAPAMISIH